MVPVIFREFLTFSNVFTSLSTVEDIIKTTVYIPTEILYSNNQLYFDSYDELESRDDYESIVQAIESGNYYFSLPELYTYDNKTDYVVSLFREIKDITNITKSIGVEQVGLDLSLIQEIVNNSNITQTGNVFLINVNNELVTFSDSETSQNIYEEAIISMDFLNITDEHWGLIETLGEEYLIRQNIDENSLYRQIKYADIFKNPLKTSEYN